MEKFHLDPTDDTPEVTFFEDTSTLVFEGSSFPADSGTFYEMIINWCDRKVYKEKRDSFFVEMFFDYINTSTSKYLVRFISKLQEFKNAGGNCEIKWFYEEGDDNMCEVGEELQHMVDLPIKIQAKEYTGD